MLTRSSLVGGCTAIFLLGMVVAGCSAGPCDEKRAIKAARAKAHSLDWETAGRSVTIRDRKALWQVDFRVPDAGTGGHEVFAIDKSTCRAVDWIGYQ